MAMQQTWSRAREIAKRCATWLTNTLCSIFLGLLLVAGVILFVLWLSLRPHRPRFHLTSFSLPGLNPQASPAGKQLTFNVSDQNPNHKIGIYYDATNASVYYYDSLVGSGPALSPWFQPNMTTTSITAVLDVVGPTMADSSWPSFSAAAQAGRVPLRLQLRTAIHFTVRMFDSGRHHMHVNCDLVVGADGNLLPESMGASCERYF